MRRVWWWSVFGLWLGAVPALGIWLFDPNSVGVQGAIDHGYVLAFAGPVLGATGTDLMLTANLPGFLREFQLGLSILLLVFSFTLVSAIAGDAPNLGPALQSFATGTLSVACLLLAATNVIVAGYFEPGRPRTSL